MMKPVFLGKYLLAACWCAAFPAAEAGAGTAQLHPASGDSLPSLCRVLDRGSVLYRDDTILVMELHEPEVVHRSISAVERSRRDTGKSSVRVPVMVLGAPVEAPQP